MRPTDYAFAPARVHSSATSFALVLVLLGTTYGLWLVALWPGVLGQDSYAILLEIERPGAFWSGKPAFWYYFVKAFYLKTHLVEVPIGVQLAFTVVVFARILSWQWVNGLKKTFLVSLVFICFAPHVVFFVGSLYPDGIFSVAVVGLLFELWLAARDRKLRFASLAMIAMMLPVALFARPNGLIYLAPVALAIFLVDRSGRRWLALITLAWCGLMFVGARAHKDISHGALFPLALFETVNFLQPRPMNLWVEQPRVSPRTLEILTRYRPLEMILAAYDPDYWDTLFHNPDGPQFIGLPEPDKEEIVRQFWRYNLWHNFPKFMGSRVNIFLVAALAQGGIPTLSFAEHVIQHTQSNSAFRRFKATTAEKLITASHDFSLAHRWILWSPLPAIALLFWTLQLGLRSRSVAILLVAVPMVLQLGAIFIFSIAGEYRYLLPFYLLPLVLLPIAVASRQAPHKAIDDPVAPTRTGRSLPSFKFSI